MSNEKNVKSRIQHKHDIEANWLKATNFIPKAGEIIIYDADDNYNYPRIKIGDGVQAVIDLPFSAGIQSDHAQNDPTAPDYIKNRTHWTEYEAIFDQTITIKRGQYTHNNTIGLQEGITYIFDVANMQFKSKCRKVIYGDSIFYVIGNALILGIGDDTGESFCIYDLPTSNTSGIAAPTLLPDGDCAVKIAAETKVHKIDPKYYDRLAWSESLQTEILPETIVTIVNGEYTFENFINFKVGSNYIINWNDTKYECKCIETQIEGMTLVGVGNTSIGGIGNDTGEPFAIFDVIENRSSGIIASSDGYYFVSISELNEVIHKIDPKYYELPCYSEYQDTIVIDSENPSIDINSPFELIGTKVKDVRENRYMLKTPSVRPEVENNTLLHAESDFISIYYSDMNMADNPILVIGGSAIAMQLCPSLLNDSLVLAYLFEQTAIADLNQTFEKGWYLIKNLPSDLIIESFNLDENPIFFPLNLEGEENSTYLQNELTPSAHVIEYVITEKNIFGDDNIKYITYLNNYVLDQIKSGALLVHGWTALGIILSGSSFIIVNNQIQTFNTGAFTIYISPIKELKKIEPQYLTHIQADYAQNDSTQANYIRNRLAWTEPVLKTLISTSLLDTDFVKDETNGTYDYINPTILNLEENKLYGINHSPDAYANLFCKKYNDTLYLGNYSLYDSNGPTEDVNFVIIDNKDSGFLLKATHTNEFATFAIETLDEVIHKIDPKFLPDSTNTQNYIQIITWEEND